MWDSRKLGYYLPTPPFPYPASFSIHSAAGENSDLFLSRWCVNVREKTRLSPPHNRPNSTTAPVPWLLSLSMDFQSSAYTILPLHLALISQNRQTHVCRDDGWWWRSMSSGTKTSLDLRKNSQLSSQKWYRGKCSQRGLCRPPQDRRILATAMAAVSKTPKGLEWCVGQNIVLIHGANSSTSRARRPSQKTLLLPVWNPHDGTYYLQSIYLWSGWIPNSGDLANRTRQCSHLHSTNELKSLWFEWSLKMSTTSVCDKGGDRRRKKRKLLDEEKQILPRSRSHVNVHTVRAYRNLKVACVKIQPSIAIYFEVVWSMDSWIVGK